MKIIDISWPISTATTGYKDKKIVNFEETRNFAKDGVRESVITLSSHTGTHVDAPAHFLQDGLTIDQMDPERFIGPCVVLDLTDVSPETGITEEHLEQFDLEEGDLVLLKTSNSFRNPTEKFDPHFVFLEASGARYLAELGVGLVGIDYLGIERNQPHHDTHRALMEGDVAIVEGLRLGHVQQGEYFLVCLPLNIVGLEAAPARAILVDGI